MSISKEMISVKETVIRVLEQRPDSRDSDKLLIALIWFTECRSKGILEDTTTNFLTKLSKGEFTSAESIRRQRHGSMVILWILMGILRIY